MLDKNYLKFCVTSFFAQRKNIYLYLVTGLIMLLIYGFFMVLYQTIDPDTARPYHVITYDVLNYYQLVYWFLIPFILLCVLGSQIHNIPIDFQVRMNSLRRLLSFYVIQISMMAIWGTFIIGFITFVSFPLSSKAITSHDFVHIFGLLIFCYLNLTNIGLLLIVLAKKFQVQISFLIVFVVSQMDQYLFGHAIFKSTNLLYTPDFSFIRLITALSENAVLMFGLLVILSVQIKRKEG